MANIASLGVKVDPRDAITGSAKASTAIKGIGTSAKNSMDKLKAMGSRMAKISGVALTGLAVSSVKTAAEFEASMKTVSAIGGVTGETFDAMRDQAMELGKTTSFSASQAADGMKFLSMAGFDAEQVMSAMPGVLDLAAASGTDLATAADIASNILSGLGLEAEQTGKLVDVMAKATSSSNMDVIEMGEAFKMVAPMADVANLSMEGMAAIIGKMADAGIKGTMAGTGLKAAISRMLDPTKKMQTAMDDLGVSIKKPDGSMKNFIDILQEMEDKGAGATEFVQIFGKQAGVKLMAATKDGVGALKDLKSKLEDSGGSAEEMADKQLEGLSGSLKILKSAFEGMQIAIGDSGLLEFVTKMAVALTEFIPKITEFANEHPLITKVGVAITALAIAVGILGGPITIVITAIGLLTAAWIKWGDDIKEVFEKVVDKIKLIMNKLKMAFIAPIKAMFEKVQAIMNKAPDWMIPDGLRDGVDGVLDEFRRMEDEAVGNSIIPDMVKRIGEVMNTLKPVMVTPAEEAATAVTNTFKSMEDSVANSMKGVIKGTMSLKEALRNIFQTYANRVIDDFANDFASNLFKSFASGGGGGTAPINIGADRFANGGRPPMNRPSIVGEKGAEMFVPDSAGTIVPNNKLGGQTINVTYSPQVNALDPRTAQAVIAENAPTIVAVVRQAFNQNGQEVAI
jgi:TP901 family phage tail tape measure protein|tara:strand:- start:426 stop:2474 length:2049 start_codon:yes stop_codon:yes gene_type:complete